MIGISEKQEEMLAFIETFVSENGYPPTYEEIRAGLNISSKSLVNYHLDVLENAQLLTRAPNTPRAIQLKNGGTAKQLSFEEILPVAIKPQPAALSQDQILELTFGLVTDETNLFALKIEPENVVNSYAEVGDVVILQRQTQAENGDMVAVHLPTVPSLSLKRYYRENGHVRLQSPDTSLQVDLLVMPEAVDIHGKVLAVIRQPN